MDKLTLTTIATILGSCGIICLAIAMTKADKSIKELKKELEDLKKELKK